MITAGISIKFIISISSFYDIFVFSSINIIISTITIEIVFTISTIDGIIVATTINKIISGVGMNRCSILFAGDKYQISFITAGYITITCGAGRSVYLQIRIKIPLGKQSINIIALSIILIRKKY